MIEIKSNDTEKNIDVIPAYWGESNE
jgi:hypothetical protein